MQMKINDYQSVDILLRAIREWDKRRSGRIQFVLDGVYLTETLNEGHLSILDTVLEDVCRIKIADYVIQLRELGVNVEMDFDVDDFLHTKALAEMAELAKQEAVAESATDAE